jgi:hypothetical protein
MNCVMSVAEIMSDRQRCAVRDVLRLAAGKPFKLADRSDCTVREVVLYDCQGELILRKVQLSVEMTERDLID